MAPKRKDSKNPKKRSKRGLNEVRAKKIKLTDEMLLRSEVESSILNDEELQEDFSDDEILDKNAREEVDGLVGKRVGEPTVISPEQVQKIATILPHTYPLVRPDFFIRPCYLELYDIIVSQLKKGYKVTVSGTPGIGKSVFYIYFFHRYRAANPDEIIVTASFRKSQGSMQCCLFDKADSSGKKLKRIPDIEGALYLFDGPPTNFFSDSRMVCFTTPHEPWFAELEKMEDHNEIYMSVWSWDEILRANRLLGLAIPETELGRRYDFFGGVARFCLCVNDAKIGKAEESIRRRIQSIRSLEILTDLLHEIPKYVRLSQRVFHMMYRTLDDGTEDMTRTELRFASTEIMKLIHENIALSTESWEKELIQILKRLPHTASLIGHMFENKCNERLNMGGTYALKGLSCGRSRKLKLKEMKYLPMERFNYPSIDGYYREGQSLFLFQMTICNSHPIKFVGIRKLFEELGITMDSFDSWDIKLVFMLAKGMGEFNVQRYILGRDGKRDEIDDKIQMVEQYLLVTDLEYKK